MITLDLLCTSLDSSGLSGVYFHIKTFYWDYADWDYRVLGRTKPTKEGRQQSTRTAAVWELPSGGQGGAGPAGRWPGPRWGSLLLSLMPALGAIGLKKANRAAGPAESLAVAFPYPGVQRGGCGAGSWQMLDWISWTLKFPSLLREAHLSASPSAS